MKNYFGATLKEFREKAGKSQREIGEKIGMTQAQISGYESGKSDPNLTTIVLLAMILELKPLELIEAALEKSIYSKKCSSVEKYKAFFKMRAVKRARPKKKLA